MVLNGVRSLSDVKNNDSNTIIIIVNRIKSLPGRLRLGKGVDLARAFLGWDQPRLGGSERLALT